MRHSAGSNYTGKYLGNFETELENILGCYSNLGPKGIDEKTRVENLVKLSL
jgi:hypothetical protein